MDLIILVMDSDFFFVPRQCHVISSVFTELSLKFTIFIHLSQPYFLTQAEEEYNEAKSVYTKLHAELYEELPALFDRWKKIIKLWAEHSW